MVSSELVLNSIVVFCLFMVYYASLLDFEKFTRMSEIHDSYVHHLKENLRG
jgi:hypothetical protein